MWHIGLLGNRAYTRGTYSGGLGNLLGQTARVALGTSGLPCMDLLKHSGHSGFVWGRSGLLRAHSGFVSGCSEFISGHLGLEFRPPKRRGKVAAFRHRFPTLFYAFLRFFYASYAKNGHSHHFSWFLRFLSKPE